MNSEDAEVARDAMDEWDRKHNWFVRIENKIRLDVVRDRERRIQKAKERIIADRDRDERE